MVWDWTLVSAIATVIGVFGGLVSLGFLIIGVRRNAAAVEGSTVQALMIFEKDVYALLMANADCFVRGCGDLAQLTDVDRFRFDRLVNAQMSLFYSAFAQFSQKLMDDEVWDAYRSAMHEDLAQPGFLASWQAMENNYPASFRRMISGT